MNRRWHHQVKGINYGRHELPARNHGTVMATRRPLASNRTARPRHPLRIRLKSSRIRSASGRHFLAWTLGSMTLGWTHFRAWTLPDEATLDRRSSQRALCGPANGRACC
eukprot:7383363-Prymnesium_polylepis.1